MSLKLILEFAVVLGALLIGRARAAWASGLWGAVGLLVLVVGFGVPPGAIPGEVLIIVLTVIMAASAMEVAGGVDFLVRVAERIIRKNPKQVTIVAPLVTYAFTFASGTGPYRVSAAAGDLRGGARKRHPPRAPDGHRHHRVAAGHHGQSGFAATAAMIWSAGGAQYRAWFRFSSSACRPRCSAVLIAAFVQLRVGKELEDDPEYQRRLKAGELTPPSRQGASATRRTAAVETRREGQRVHLLWRRGAGRVGRDCFPRCEPFPARPRIRSVVGMPIAIAIVMLAVAAIILTVTRAPGGRSAEVQDLPVRRHGHHRHPRPRVARRYLYQRQPGSHHRRPEQHGQRPRRGRLPSACSSPRCCSTARRRRRAR